MKILVWVLAAIVAAGWTGLAAALASMAGWIASNAATMPNWPEQLVNWPIPPWLAVWLDPAMLEGLRSTLSGLMQWTSGVLPAVSPVLHWIAPLVWVGWALGMLCLLAVAVGVHLLVGRTTRQATLPPGPPQRPLQRG